MSYAKKTRRLVNRYRNIGGHRFKTGIAQARPMSGFFDDLFGGVLPLPSDSDAQCLQAGNDAAAGFDAKRADLNQNWNPNGFYAPNDMSSLVSQVFTMLHSAESALEQLTTTNTSVKIAQDDIFRKYAEVQTYQNAVKQALASNQTAINAPGFRDWVIAAMGAASAGITAAATNACLEPWWLGALADFQSAFDAVWNAARKIVGIVLTAADTVLTLADNTLDVAAMVAKYGPWAALAVGGYLVVKELKKRRYL